MTQKNKDADTSFYDPGQRRNPNDDKEAVDDG